MKFEEYARFDATDLARLIRAGEVTAGELRSLALAAIEAQNPRLNAALATLPDTPVTDGPFAGVPFVIKELGVRARGAPARMGCRAAIDIVADSDSTLMTRFRNAGLNLVATTQTPELGYCATTEPVAFGPVHNPWRAGHSAGGSSGGSGAAVAAGWVPIGHANDGGGSIRIPASCNGLVGLKPTRDRTPTGPDTGDPLFGHAIEFAVTRSVRDCATLLDAVAGPDVGAPGVIAPPEHPFAEAVTRPASGMTVAVMADSFFGHAAGQDAEAAVVHTARLLRDLGHTVADDRRLELEWEPFVEHVNVLWCVFLAAGMQALTARPDTDHFEAVTLTCAEFGRNTSAVALTAALDYVNRISRRTGEYFQSIDVLLTPTLATAPPAHGVIDQNDASLSATEWTRRTFTYAPYTPLFNSTGQPAVSLPVWWTPDGMPLGVQLVGHMGAEAALLNLAAQLEAAAGWRARQATCVQPLG